MEKLIVNKSIIIFSAVAVLLISAVVFLYYSQSRQPELTEQKPPQEQSQENPEQPYVQEPNIKVSVPQVNAEIGLPLNIEGEARVFENNINYRLKDSDGSVLVENFATAASKDMGEFGPFSVYSAYPEPKGAGGTLEVFWYSPKDGSEQDKIIIPVVFKTVEDMTVKIFFNSRTLDPGALDCNKTYPVERRIPKSSGVARAAIEELLKGVTVDEGDKGYFTSINSGVKLQSINISGGVAYADFDETLQQSVGGSCRVAAISSQIRETLKQFSSIKNVVISINGRSEDILQP